MRPVRFSKAHACGNDFLIVEQEELDGLDLAEAAVRLCHRHTGVGADGVEVVRQATAAGGSIRLYNADGSVAEISGNGTRCVAAWMAARYQLAPGTTLAIETDAGLRRSTIVTSSGGRAEVTTGMGIPSLRPGRVRLSDGREQEGVVVSTGNPHFVIRAEQESFAAGGRPWRELGEEIAAHPDFPGGTNVEFWLPRGGNEIEIRIFERGVGPTRSSGTGTSASAAAAIASGSARSPLSVRAPGGVQTVEWAGAGSELQLRGPAERIAEGVAWL